MSETLKTFDDQLNNILDTYVRKPTLIKGVVHLCLILYAAKLAPELPQSVLTLFQNNYFKLFIFSLILWTAQFSPSTSILIAIAFLVSTNYINNKPLFEFLENTTIAPSHDTALNSAMGSVQPMLENDDDATVYYIQQQDATTIIQPKIISTDKGPVVVNPSVVIAPIIVTTSDGNKMTVTPKVTTVSSEKTNVAPQPMNSMPTTDSAPKTNPTADSMPKMDPMAQVSPMNNGDMHNLQMPEIPVSVDKDSTMGIETSCYTPRNFNINNVTSYSPDMEYGDFKL
jgi:hypothetical protein